MPKPEIELFKEHDMTFDTRPIMLKVNKIIAVLDTAGIITATKPAPKKNIVCHGSETNNIE